MEHPDASLPYVSLYAHLANVPEGLSLGSKVEAGQQLGTMGRSARSAIPKSRAHLHFEIALLKSGDFQRWYDRKGFGSINTHGRYNGMNLMGFDPLEVYRRQQTGQFTDMAAHVRELPTAFTLRVSTRRTPDFVQRHPALVTAPVPAGGAVAWLVEFTWHGLPKSWRPLSPSEVPAGREGDIALMHLDADAFPPRCSRTFQMAGGKPTELTASFKDSLRLIFGF